MASTRPGAWPSPALRLGRSVCARGRVLFSPKTSRDAAGCSLARALGARSAGCRAPPAGARSTAGHDNTSGDLAHPSAGERHAGMCGTGRGCPVAWADRPARTTARDSSGIWEYSAVHDDSVLCAWGGRGGQSGECGAGLDDRGPGAAGGRWSQRDPGVIWLSCADGPGDVRPVAAHVRRVGGLPRPRALAAGRGVYLAGLVLTCVGAGSDPGQAGWPGRLDGLGMLLMGGVILFFVGVFLRLMRARGRLPRRVALLAPSPEGAARSYTVQVARERSAYGPFVAVVASAYVWAVLGGGMLIGDGLALLLGIPPPFALDAIRHSFAIGFIVLMICGVAPRMLPGFSGGSIVSPALVGATLWLGNSAAALRVGPILLSPLLARFTGPWQTLDAVAFGLSGPVGLALAICLAVNLWPALRYRRPEQEGM